MVRATKRNLQPSGNVPETRTSESNGPALFPGVGTKAKDLTCQPALSFWRGVSAMFLVMAIAITSLAETTQYHDQDTRGVPKTSATAPPPEVRIDINHASIDELLKVPGMTQSWAGRIVRFRPYRTKLDLLDKGIVTAKVYDHIKDFVIAHRALQ